MNGGNRLRRAASLVLALAVTAGSALAAGEEYIRVEDTVRSDPSCRVFDLAGDGEFPETFSYDVPEGGVTALIFFKNGCWNCANLFRGLSVLTEDPRVNVTAVSMQDRAETQSFADAYIGDKLERVYYQPVSYQNPGWAYVDLLSGRDGGRVSMGTAFVVLVTEEDGTRWIRWYGMSVSNAQAVKDQVDALLGGTPEEPEGLPASVLLSTEDCGGGTASFTAGITNRSGEALPGRLWAAGYAGGAPDGFGVPGPDAPRGRLLHGALCRAGGGGQAVLPGRGPAAPDEAAGGGPPVRGRKTVTVLLLF